MADIAAATWTETDSGNTTAPPDGWPEGQAPSTVNDCARMMMGATKRFWSRANATLTTAGTTTAYTLTYDVAGAAYYEGELFVFVLNATTGAAPTLDINGLGARNLRKFVSGAWANVAAGDFKADEVMVVRTAAATFDVISRPPSPSQFVSTIVTALSTGTGTIPLDDTIPQKTEGNEVMTLAITPQSTTSTLTIDIVVVCSASISAANMIVALFQDSTDDALAAVSSEMSTITSPVAISFRHVMASGTTSATTFKVRVGSASAATTTFNGANATRIFGGRCASSITIEERA